jgi:hypothetical protein
MWPFSKKIHSLSSVLNQTFRIKVQGGVIFKIRKLNPIDFISGAKALQMHFDTYRTANESQRMDLLVSNKNKIQDHYRDVIMASVVEPKLCYKKEDANDGTNGKEMITWVDDLFTDWGLVNELYEQIMMLTYGKKKLKS